MFRYMFTIVLATVTVVISLSFAVGAAADRWLDAMRAKSWVTCFVSTSQERVVPAPMDRLIVTIGGEHRTVYDSTPRDFHLGDPVVSRDGTRLAFIKVEADGQKVHKWLYVMSADGTDVRRLLQLKAPPVVGVKGAYIGVAPVAWSHNNRLLAVFGTLPDEPIVRERSSETLQTLMRVEVATGHHLALRRRLGRIDEGHVITSQAWASDDRTLAYVNNQNHVIMLDTAADTEEDLGPGVEPTWSPDGRFIVFKEPYSGPTSRKEGDYFIFDVATRSRSVLFANSNQAKRRFLGPANWSPDSNFLVVRRVRGEVSDFYVVDRRGGNPEKLPHGDWGYSWGGRP